MTANMLSNATMQLWINSNDPGVSEPSVNQGNFFLNSSTGALFYCQTPTAGLQAWNKISIIAYEEQQPFTPTIIGSTGAGAGTYTLQAGYYTRIGNQITVAIEITWTAHTGTGDLWVGNLPFTIRNSANYSPEGIVNTINMTLPGGANRTSIGSGVAGTTHLTVEVATNAGANSPVQMQATGTIHATLTYLT